MECNLPALDMTWSRETVRALLHCHCHCIIIQQHTTTMVGFCRRVWCVFVYVYILITNMCASICASTHVCYVYKSFVGFDLLECTCFMRDPGLVSSHLKMVLSINDPTSIIGSFSSRSSWRCCITSETWQMATRDAFSGVKPPGQKSNTWLS